jgi:hypothetical protein
VSRIVWARWGALALYVAAVYAILPYGPRIGLGVVRTAVGFWLLGPGLATLTVGALVALLGVLRRRGAPAWSYAVLVVSGVAYVVAFSWLRAQRLERTHLPEYGIAAWLAWRALDPLVPGRLAGYGLAVLLGAIIGLCDELLQSVTPGRVYDPRDIGMNALGALLGTVVLAALQARGAGEPGLTAGSSVPRSPRAAES